MALHPPLTRLEMNGLSFADHDAAFQAVVGLLSKLRFLTLDSCTLTAEQLHVLAGSAEGCTLVVS